MTSWRVLVAILILVTGTVGVGVWGISQQIRSRVLDATVQSTTVLSSLVVDRSITFNDIDNGIHSKNRAKLDSDVFLLKSRELMLGLRVWRLTDGQLIYADPDQPDDGSRLGAAPLDRARAGEAFAKETTGLRYGETLTVYYPYDANGDGQVDAAAEVMLRRQEINESIAHSTGILYAGALLVLTLALVGIVQVRRRQYAQDHMAAHDTLTGLGNRLLLRRRAEPLLAGASTESPLALLLIDLDGFKGVNDTLGHHAGDELLVAVSTAIVDACRPGDTAIRLGGDEFAVLLPRSGHTEALRMARDIRQAVRTPAHVAGLTVEIDASIGVAWAPDHHRHLSGLLHCADVAMYQAKQTGGGVVGYDPVDDVQTDRNVTLLPELRRAMQEGRLELHYQPVVAVDGTVREVEALLRWRHEQRGLLDAGEFLPSVGRTSLVRPLTEWVLAEAAAGCARWRSAGYDLRVAVNVSARTLIEPNFTQAVRDAATLAGLRPSAIRLEIAEAAVLADPVRAATAIARLREHGVSVVLDDVSAAYTSLTSLVGSQPDEIKIDPSLVGAVSVNAAAYHAVSGLVGYSRQLGLTAIAEGVESDEIRAVVTRLGCSAVQGYAICPPLPAGDLTDWLDRHARPRSSAVPAPRAFATADSEPVSEGTTP